MAHSCPLEFANPENPIDGFLLHTHTDLCREEPVYDRNNLEENLGFGVFREWLGELAYKIFSCQESSPELEDQATQEVGQNYVELLTQWVNYLSSKVQSVDRDVLGREAEKVFYERFSVSAGHSSINELARFYPAFIFVLGKDHISFFEHAAEFVPGPYCSFFHKVIDPGHWQELEKETPYILEFVKPIEESWGEIKSLLFRETLGVNHLRQFPQTIGFNNNMVYMDDEYYEVGSRIRFEKKEGVNQAEDKLILGLNSKTGNYWPASGAEPRLVDICTLFGAAMNKNVINRSKFKESISDLFPKRNYGWNQDEAPFYLFHKRVEFSSPSYCRRLNFFVNKVLEKPGTSIWNFFTQHKCVEMKHCLQGVKKALVNLPSEKISAEMKGLRDRKNPF